MATAAMTDYERLRLENIRRNDEMIASLMIRSKASDLATSLKRSAATQNKPKKVEKSTKKPRVQDPVVVRRSLRHRGLPPEPTQPKSETPRDRDFPAEREQLLIGDAFVVGSESTDRNLVGAILSASERASLDLAKEKEVGGLFDPKRDLMLREENVKKVVEGRILSVRFLPFWDRTVIVAGDKLGNVGFWDVDVEEGDSDGVYVYVPHSGPVSGISVHPFSPAKIFTCSYDGLIRLMDVQDGTFNMIHSSDYLIYSICQSPVNTSTIYFAEGAGELKLWDERTGRVSHTWDLHEKRINTIDFNPENPNMMATSSRDGMARIWDLRVLKKHQPDSLKTVKHRCAVHSAYFSPGGLQLATTSYDDTVGIASGVNFDDQSLVKHDNQTGRWISSFRAIWGWDDSHIFLGNMKRAVDIISANSRTTTSVFSEYMTSIGCRLAAHPHTLGKLASATAGGKVFYWTRT
ncbi:DNA damage-binding protein cmr1 [Curcuma longa]|uniref:DNA damage-binding protein cmr1 n=1 Tax=Curcuma longa TaxID=136217 RepID=UPI003D9EEAE4